jgi:hypothetical protein
MTDGGEQPARFFYGLQPRWLSWDRLYRVYVSDKMLSGAYIAGQLYDEQSAALQLQQLGLFLRPLVRRRFAQRQEREAMYDAVDPFGPLLLSHDKRNFQIARSDVVRTRFQRNRSLWAPFNVGAVELELLDGTTLRFILVGDQQPDDILRIIQRFDPAVEVSGKPNPLARPKPMSPGGKRFYFAMLACLFLGFGGLFGYVAGAGLAPDPMHWPLAIVNAFMGIWCLVKAWKIPENRPEPDGDGLLKES